MFYMDNLTNFNIEYFKKGYKYNMHIMGIAILNDSKCQAKLIDLYLYSHNTYFIIRTGLGKKRQSFQHNFIISQEPDTLSFPDYITILHKRSAPSLGEFKYYIFDSNDNVINFDVDAEELKSFVHNEIQKRKKISTLSDPNDYLSNAFVSDKIVILPEAPNDIFGTYVKIDKNCKVGTGLDLIKEYFPENDFLYKKNESNKEYQKNSFEADLRKYLYST